MEYSIYTWYQLEAVSVEGMEEQKIYEVPVEDKKVGLVKKDGKLFAFAATCPHAGAPFCDGWMDAQGRLVCPLHKYRFDPANGRNTSGEGYKLKTYPVEIREGKIFVGLMNL